MTAFAKQYAKKVKVVAKYELDGGLYLTFRLLDSGERTTNMVSRPTYDAFGVGQVVDVRLYAGRHKCWYMYEADAINDILWGETHNGCA